MTKTKLWVENSIPLEENSRQASTGQVHGTKTTSTVCRKRRMPGKRNSQGETTKNDSLFKGTATAGIRVKITRLQKLTPASVPVKSSTTPAQIPFEELQKIMNEMIESTRSIPLPFSTPDAPSQDNELSNTPTPDMGIDDKEKCPETSALDAAKNPSFQFDQ